MNAMFCHVSKRSLTRGATHRRHVSNVLVLLDGTTDRNHEQQDPRHAHLGEHLQVDVGQTRVQAGAHEDVVEPVTGHTDGLAAVVEDTRKEIDEQSDGE